MMLGTETQQEGSDGGGTADTPAAGAQPHATEQHLSVLTFS